MQTEDIPQKHFANISRRTQAVIIDTMFLFVLFMSTSFLASKLDINPYVKVGVIGFLMLFIEPLLVTFRGASVGHYFKGLRVQSSKTGKNLNIIAAFIRFAIKSIIGLFSLIFILTTKKHQALHDMMSGSVVVMNAKSIAEGYIGLSERDAEKAGYVYPSRLRRSLVILFYLLMFFISLLTLMITAFSPDCIVGKFCSLSEEISLRVIDISTFAIMLAIIVFGWRGQLFGALRRQVKAENNMSQ